MKNSFYLKLKFELHAISCPGVWLCKKEYLQIIIKTLGYKFKKINIIPDLPILCNDIFLIEGYYKSVETFSQLEEKLGDEYFHINLLQNGRILAYFHGKLNQILNPRIPPTTCIHHINVHLLMKPSVAFPGILAPKIEISAQAIAQNKRENFKCESGSNCIEAHVLIPILTNEKKFNSEKNTVKKRRQNQVCHTEKYLKDNFSTINHSSQLYSEFSTLKHPDCSTSKSKSEILYPRINKSLFSSNFNACQLCSKGSYSCASSTNIMAHMVPCEICNSYKNLFL